MLCNNRPSDSKESRSTRLAGKLSLGSYMEESKVTCDKVMCDAGSLVQNVDLAAEHVLGLFVCVWGDVAGGSCLDAVES